MSKRVGRFVLVVLIGLWSHTPVQAQEASRPLRPFVSAGGGFGSHGALYASLTLSHRTGDYILRGAQAYDLSFGVPFGGVAGGDWQHALTEGAFLYGRRARTSWGWAGGALGVAYVHSEQIAPMTPGEEPSTSTIGLAAQAGVAWTPHSWLGFGLTAVANLNDLRPLGAVTLSVHLGRSR
jgi:uncharacterized membrane protein YdcZ (DUF606 family)